MLTLSDATSNVRLLAKILVGVVVLVVIGFLVFRLVVYVIESQRPPEEPPRAFGDLPQIPFPTSGVSPSDFTYQINTLDGKLPPLPDRLPVYTTIQPKATLLGLQDSRDRILALGYAPGETRLDRNIYQWTKETGEIIKYDILTHNFEIFSSYIFNPPTTNFAGVSDSQIVSQIFTLLTQLGIGVETLQDAGGATYAYFTLQEAKLVTVDRLDTAQIVRIDLYQNDVATQEFQLEDEKISSLPVVYPIAGKSTMNFLLEPGRGSGRIVEAHFTEFPINNDESSEYPLITVDAAWEKLESGDAYVARYDPNAPRVDILDVELGYFLGDTDTGYAMPVVRFVGQNFEAYVDGIDRTPPAEQGG